MTPDSSISRCLFARKGVPFKKRSPPFSENPEKTNGGYDGGSEAIAGQRRVTTYDALRESSLHDVQLFFAGHRRK